LLSGSKGGKRADEKAKTSHLLRKGRKSKYRNRIKGIHGSGRTKKKGESACGWRTADPATIRCHNNPDADARRRNGLYLSDEGRDTNQQSALSKNGKKTTARKEKKEGNKKRGCATKGILEHVTKDH